MAAATTPVASRRAIKRRYRIIDFKRRKDGVPATVASIEYDPNRTARIALLHYVDGHKAYILAPARLAVGATVQSGEDADIKVGNCLPLSSIRDAQVVVVLGDEPVAERAGRLRARGERHVVRHRGPQAHRGDVARVQRVVQDADDAGRPLVAGTLESHLLDQGLVAAAAAALTVYDMCKALDKTIEITGIVLVEKTGGKSGDFRRSAVTAKRVRAKVHSR